MKSHRVPIVLVLVASLPLIVPDEDTLATLLRLRQPENPDRNVAASKSRSVLHSLGEAIPES